MPMAKKERPNHKRWWQTKNGSGKQTADTKRNKQNSWNHLKNAKGGLQVEKTPPNHNSLIDYCLQQMSGRLHWLHLLQP